MLKIYIINSRCSVLQDHAAKEEVHQAFASVIQAASRGPMGFFEIVCVSSNPKP